MNRLSLHHRSAMSLALLAIGAPFLESGILDTRPYPVTFDTPPAKPGNPQHLEDALQEAEEKRRRKATRKAAAKTTPAT